MYHNMIQTFDSGEHYHNVLKQVGSNKYVVINFSATWCIPCKKVAPQYESLSEEDNLMTKCYFYKVDVDEHSEIAEICDTKKMPTFQVYSKQNKVFESIGPNLDDLRNFLSTN